jgi:hypothetical protein
MWLGAAKARKCPQVNIIEIKKTGMIFFSLYWQKKTLVYKDVGDGCIDHKPVQLLQFYLNLQQIIAKQYDIILKGHKQVKKITKIAMAFYGKEVSSIGSTEKP